MLKTWTVKRGPLMYDDFHISGYNIEQAVHKNVRKLAYSVKPDSEHILSINDVSIDWSNEILGGMGGGRVIIDCSVRTACTPDDPHYNEYYKAYEVWIYCSKSDIEGIKE